MRLFLSSYRAGRHDDKLQEFAGKINKVAVITNAKDYKTPQDRDFKVQDNFNWWRSIGLEPIEVDLRAYFHKTGARELLSGFDFVWLAGGNVFLLRRALRYTGLDEFFYDAVRKNEIILGGESAGAMITGPTLRYSERNIDEDRETHIPEGYNHVVIWEGLDLVDYVPIPHFDSPEYAGADDYILKLRAAGIPYKTMTDRQAIIISGDREEFLR